MSQLKQPGFLKKIEKAISAIPGLENTQYGLIGTCRLNGIDPEAYLRHILSVLPEWPSNKVAELLPWNVDLTNK